MESSGSKRNSTNTKWSNKGRYFIEKYTSENGVATAVWKLKRKFPDLNESTVWSFRKKSRRRAEEGFNGKKKTIQSNCKTFVTKRSPFDPQITRFNGSNLLVYKKSTKLCNQYKYRKYNCSCIDSKISSSCRKYWFGVNSLGLQSFQTDGICEASKNFIKSRNSWYSKERNSFYFIMRLLLT